MVGVEVPNVLDPKVEVAPNPGDPKVFACVLAPKTLDVLPAPKVELGATNPPPNPVLVPPNPEVVFPNPEVVPPPKVLFAPNAGAGFAPKVVFAAPKLPKVPVGGTEPSPSVGGPGWVLKMTG